MITDRQSYIGKKFLGLKFQKHKDFKNLHYSKDMDKLVGLVLEIEAHETTHDSFRINGKNGRWYYPAKLVIEQIQSVKEKSEDEIIEDVFSIINKLK